MEFQPRNVAKFFSASGLYNSRSLESVKSTGSVHQAGGRACPGLGCGMREASPTKTRSSWSQLPQAMDSVRPKLGCSTLEQDSARAPEAGNCLQQAQGCLRYRAPCLRCPRDSTEGRAGQCWLPGGTRMSQQGPKLPHASRICAENQVRRRTLRKVKG